MVDGVAVHYGGGGGLANAIADDESQAWFEAMTARIATSGPPPLTFQDILGSDFVDVARNQVRNLTERRVRTVTYICGA